jgi:hypothetical protein
LEIVGQAGPDGAWTDGPSGTNGVKMRPRPITGASALALLGLVFLILACFGPVLFRGRQFAYRDSGNFYYPLYLRVQQEWEAGRLPLWMPEENSGMPLLANPTAAVLYPGRLIFAALPYPWAVRMYVVAHLALAFVAMRALLRHWSISPTGATIGAMAYAFGAPVLFLYCNVVFLVGAAWTPLGLRSADRWVRLRDRRALGGLAAVLALQTLGGDPEAAYLVAIAAAGYAIGLAYGRKSPSWSIPRFWWVAIAPVVYAGLLVLTWLSPSPAASVAIVGAWLAAAGWTVRGVVRRGWLAGAEGSLLGLGAAFVLALALCGAQLVPAIEFLARSIRTTELGESDRYAFSLSPSRTIGAFWPNVMGAVATAQEWPLALPSWFDETKRWFPSLYLGGLTLVLAAAGAGLRGSPPWRSWLTAIVIVGSLAAMGQYTSPLFWARKVPALTGWLGPPDDPDMGGRADGALQDGDGGVYWMFTAAFPGFRSFRYPAKLLVPACLGIAGLAGLGWDELSAGRRRRRAVATGITLAGLGAVALVTLLGGRGAAAEALASRAEQAASVFGPLDPAGALGAAIGGLGHGTAALAAAAAIAAVATRRPAAAGGIALAVMVADLAIANAQLVVTAPQSVFDAEPRVLRLIREAETTHPAPGPYRAHRMRWSPTAWALRASPDRPEEILAWERDTLGGHHALPLGLAFVDTKGTTELADYSLFFRQGRVAIDADVARGLGLKPGQLVVYHTRRGYDLWGARYLILPARLAWNSLLRGYTSFLSDFDEIYPAPGAFDGPGGRERRERWLRGEDFQILRNRAAYPRAWVVHRARFTDIRGRGEDAQRAAIDEILFQNDELWHDDARRVYDPREVAWIEGAERRSVAPQLSGAGRDPSERVEVIRDDPTRVELVAHLRTPGMVVLADTFYPGWRLTVDGRAAWILRTNGAMRGALVGAGEHRLVYRYDPTSLKVGAGLTIAGIAALVLLVRSRSGFPA